MNMNQAEIGWYHRMTYTITFSYNGTQYTWDSDNPPAGYSNIDNDYYIDWNDMSGKDYYFGINAIAYFKHIMNDIYNGIHPDNNTINFTWNWYKVYAEPEAEEPTVKLATLIIGNFRNGADPQTSVTVYNSNCSGTYTVDTTKTLQVDINDSSIIMVNPTGGHVFNSDGYGYTSDAITVRLILNSNILSTNNYNNNNVTINYGSLNEGDILEIYVEQEYECFVEGTLITLADRTTKCVEDITYDDELLVWNFDEGKLDTAKPIWIDTPGIADFYYVTTFNDGTKIKTVGPERLNGASHRIFNMDKQHFEYLSDSIWNDVYSLEGNKQIVSHQKVKEAVRYYNLMTNKHINLFANGLLTSSRLNNLYPIKDMKFVKEERNIDLSVYKDIPQEYIDGLRLSEQLTDVSNYIKNMVRKALKKD